MCKLIDVIEFLLHSSFKNPLNFIIIELLFMYYVRRMMLRAVFYIMSCLTF
jgi:hypothetical protein